MRLLHITLTAAKGNRSLTETSTSINIRYGDTATVSGIGYPNGTACQSVITTDGNYTVVQFKNTGACNWAVPNGVTSVQVLAVGGGGAGGHGRGGGGGAGGYTNTTMSVTSQSIVPIYVAKGGTASASTATNGETTTVLGISVAGGGYGGFFGAAGGSGASGGGGGSSYSNISPLGGSGIAGQGNNAARAGWASSDSYRYTSGGGGAGGASSNVQSGGNHTGTGTPAPDGGAGIIDTITGVATTYAMGGGGATALHAGEDTDNPSYNATSYFSSLPGNIGGACGGVGAYSYNPGVGPVAATAGASNTGCGGGGGGHDGTNEFSGGAGGSGIVVIRFATPAPYTAPLVDGNLTYSTTTSALCTVDTSTGLVTATGGLGTCSIVAWVPAGTYYVAESTTINITIRAADTVTVSAKPIISQFYTQTQASLGLAETITGLLFSDTKSAVTYNYAAAPTSTCATGGTCSVGDVGPGGGIVFYDAGSTQAWGRYLEAAPYNWSGVAETTTTQAWCSNTSSTIGYTSTSIGDGLLNSTIMLAGCTSGAAKLANAYVGGTRNDWYLPSQSELAQLYSARATSGLNLASASYSYWSSNETSAANAVTMAMASGALNATAKSVTTPIVRPIRAFDVVTNTYASSTTIPTNAGTYIATPGALVLAASRPTSNYVNIKYETTTAIIKKVKQSALTLYSNITGIAAVNLVLHTAGGSGTGAITYKIVPGGSAPGCSVAGTYVSATDTGTCLVAAIRAADNNYYAAAAPTVVVTFQKYISSFVAAASGSGPTIVLVAAPAVIISAMDSITITSLSTLSAAAGATMVITGTGFVGINSVNIGPRSPVTSFTVNSTTQITVTISAANKSGTVRVRNDSGTIVISTQTFNLLAAPVFTLSNTSDSVTVGSPLVGFTPINTGGTPTSYSISGGTLPAGVTLDASSGALSGSPATTLAATTFTITATNAVGSATQSYTLTVGS